MINFNHNLLGIGAFMFIDRVKIHIKGGNGGNGLVSFHREKFVTSGGPDGGDGGKGGNIIFEASNSLNTLMDFRYKKKFIAANGDDGGARNCTGKSAEDLIIKVPVGTIIREAVSNKVMLDLVTEGEQRILIKGCKGGKGNQHYATATRQVPQYAQKGTESRSYDVILELKLIADVGIIGFPNVGKSTLLSMVTNANPKIANYHFTTLSPNLGVVRSKWGSDFVMADIPGLIEGASEGLGLGHEFLRHVERTKVFVHVVDAAGIEGGDPVECIKKINAELEAFNSKLLLRPQVIAANKTDLPEALENLDRIKKECELMGYKVYPISAATNTGLDELLAGVAEILKDYPENIVFEEDFSVYTEEIDKDEPFFIKKTPEGFFAVEGAGLEKMVSYTDFETDKGYAFFQRYIREKGIVKALENAGIKEGDTVTMYDLEFDYYK